MDNVDKNILDRGGLFFSEQSNKGLERFLEKEKREKEIHIVMCVKPEITMWIMWIIIFLKVSRQYLQHLRLP